MFLPHSSSPRAPARLLTLLPEVVADVAEQAFFAWAEPCGDVRFAELLVGSSTSPAWHARVGFCGVVTGALEVLLPDELARELGVALSGRSGGSGEDGLTDEELGDVAGELANMLCGALLTRAGRDQPFVLRPPQVARTTGVREGGRGPSDDLLFSVNDRPVVVRFKASEA